jgi:hypothetical protein
VVCGLYLFFLLKALWGFVSRVYITDFSSFLARDVEPSSSLMQGAVGAATSAAVPSADDLGNGPDADGDVAMNDKPS